MKKISILILMASLAIACGGNKNAAVTDYGAVLTEMTEKIKSINAELKAAKDAKAAAKGIENFAAFISEMKGKKDVLDKKYPEFAKEMPAELKGKNEELDKAGKELAQSGIMEVMKKYATAPEMQEAMKKLQASAASMASSAPSDPKAK